MTSHSSNRPSQATVQHFVNYPDDMWRDTDDSIAATVGCSASTVSRVRKALGKRQSDAWRKRMPRGCDWSRSNHELAAQYGMTHEAVGDARRKHSPDYKLRGVLRGGKLRGPDVPWELPNSELATMYGITPSAVGKYRMVHRKRAPAPRGSAALDWTKVDLTRSITELKAELGCSSTLISRMREKLGVIVPGGWRQTPPQARSLPKPRKSQAEKAAEAAEVAARLKRAREAWF